ncbi:hypothetical protein K488DRAFT_10513, partial [Vararia minispora EC-137]
PLITPPPAPPSPPKRKRRRTTPARHLESRQTIFNQSAVDAAKTQCANVGNDVISCFPAAGDVVPQHEQAYFVWNSRRPQLTQTNLVNIYLLRAGTNEIVLSWLNQQNPTNGLAGNIGVDVGDVWFPNNGTSWSGSNITTPLYFVITRADQGLDGSQVPQETFSAVQTTFADSVVSSMASVSSASSASAVSASLASASSASVASKSVASVSSVSAAAASSIANTNPTASPNSSSTTPGSLQRGSDSSFPHWAIAVIVVLGVLAIITITALGFLILRRMRQREALANSQRNSMGSASPMIPGGAGAASRGGPQSPAMEETRRLFDPPVSAAGHASLNSPNDDASMTSHAQSQAHSTGDSGLFSGADAAIMADAFRKVLRKPDFAGRPPIEEGESPDSQEHKPENQLMNWELAEEGRDIRSVGSSRGVRVETTDDDGGTT